MTPIICFGQQPCGIFPKRFLVAKILTARRLQKQLGGEIVFFYHDADHDPRETKTTLRHRQSHKPLDYNFEYENKIQRKFSPLYLKRVPAEWHKKMSHTLPNYVSAELVEAFKSTPPGNVADFCLEIYRKQGLLDGIRVARSSDSALRTAACEINDFFADVPYENEIVRARHIPAAGGATESLSLHEGGPNYITLPCPPQFSKTQISPTRDSRLRWMQSVLHCTHYIAGMGEQAYLNKAEAPEIAFVQRDPIENQDEAWTEGAS
ncbi:MAG TPA: hypothetical protein VHM90_01110 [Phycisphaerae bacterium]|nr:hypothetical protein [Phycisphaerae bacterium]